jgi:hypothetical protein
VETSAPDTTESVETPNTQEIVRHTVAPGEYLSLIARNYGVSWVTIAEANGITDPNHIFTGMQLIIPGGDPSVVSTYSPIRSIAQNLPDVGAHWGAGRELVVDLSTQMAYAYEVRFRHDTSAARALELGRLIDSSVADRGRDPDDEPS